MRPCRNPYLLVRSSPIVSFVCISSNAGCSSSSLNKGRTANGEIGLFPRNTTTSNPPEAIPTSSVIGVRGPEPEPHTPTVPQTLREVFGTGSTGSTDHNSLGNSCVNCRLWRQRLISTISVNAHRESTPHHISHCSITPPNMLGFHSCQDPISSKIRSLLVCLTKRPSEYDEIAPKIEYWIEYVLREHLTTVDELVEGVSYVAWEDGGSYSNVGRFLKELRDAPHRSEQARSFVTQFSSHTLRWFAIASVENLSITRSGGLIASGGGNGFICAASFVGHLIWYGLLSDELVRQHLIKPLINHHDEVGEEPVRANAIYQLFLAAGSTLL